MGRTLFWYLFADLLRIFALTATVLSGIMSFGGLLRPLTQHGLDAIQVATMLMNFLPAMMTYSLPIAALFATTVVYGRLSADNELTACRAAGISHLTLALPAMVMGLVVSGIAVLLLSFVVPYFTLNVEKTIYSNLGQLVVNQIERRQRITLEGPQPITIFAQSAQMLPSLPDRPNDQLVRLDSPTILTFSRATPQERGLREPAEFYTARSAVAAMRQNEDGGEITMEVILEGGNRFPRRLTGGPEAGVQVSVGTTMFRSAPLPSPIRENTKFMDIRRLQFLLDNPEKSRRVSAVLNDFIREDAEKQFLQDLARKLDDDGRIRLGSGTETYDIIRGTAQVTTRAQRLVLQAPSDASTAEFPRLTQVRADRAGFDALSRQIRVRAFPDFEQQIVTVEVDLMDAVVNPGRDETRRTNTIRSFVMPMPGHVYEISKARTAAFYSASNALDHDRRLRLLRDLYRLTNSIVSEIHSRLSFSVSCLILVMVGCALGMLFRSGNFLSAFALSVIPALLCISLIMAGQKTCENIPWNVGAGFRNPLQLGLFVIWLGNGIVLLAAVGLLGALSRR